MRLIDADAIVKELSDKYIVPVDEATRGVAAFMGIQTRQAINNAPTIEAIPLEWIEKQKAGCVYGSISWIALEALLKTWREEKDEVEECQQTQK